MNANFNPRVTAPLTSLDHPYSCQHQSTTTSNTPPQNSINSVRGCMATQQQNHCTQVPPSDGQAQQRRGGQEIETPNIYTQLNAIIQPPPDDSSNHSTSSRHDHLGQHFHLSMSKSKRSRGTDSAASHTQQSFRDIDGQAFEVYHDQTQMEAVQLPPSTTATRPDIGLSQYKPHIEQSHHPKTSTVGPHNPQHYHSGPQPPHSHASSIHAFESGALSPVSTDSNIDPRLLVSHEQGSSSRGSDYQSNTHGKPCNKLKRKASVVDVTTDSEGEAVTPENHKKSSSYSSSK